jgi:hypothetical protein
MVATNVQPEMVATSTRTSRRRERHTRRWHPRTTALLRLGSLEGGVSIKALSEYLGHADPGFTLRTYTHLMPASHDQTRRVIDSRITRSDGLDTAYEPVDQENRSSEGVWIKSGNRGMG